MRQKNSLWFWCLLGVLTSIQAQNIVYASFNLGAEIGYGSGKVKHTNQTVDPAGLVSAKHTHLSPSGSVGGLSIGYSMALNKVFLGFDIYGTLSSIQAKYETNQNDPDITTKVRLKNTWGVKFRPGVFVTPETVFHGTIGFASSKFTLSASDNQELPLIFPKQSVSTRKNGVTFGGGIATQVAPRLSVGLECTRTLYKALPRLIQTGQGVGLGNTIHQDMKPAINVISLRAVYSF